MDSIKQRSVDIQDDVPSLSHGIPLTIHPHYCTSFQEPCHTSSEVSTNHNYYASSLISSVCTGKTPYLNNYSFGVSDKSMEIHSEGNQTARQLNQNYSTSLINDAKCNIIYSKTHNPYADPHCMTPIHKLWNSKELYHFLFDPKEQNRLINNTLPLINDYEHPYSRNNSFLSTSDSSLYSYYLHTGPTDWPDHINFPDSHLLSHMPLSPLRLYYCDETAPNEILLMNDLEEDQTVLHKAQHFLKKLISLNLSYNKLTDRFSETSQDSQYNDSMTENTIYDTDSYTDEVYSVNDTAGDHSVFNKETVEFQRFSFPRLCTDHTYQWSRETSNTADFMHDSITSIDKKINIHSRFYPYENQVSHDYYHNSNVSIGNERNESVYYSEHHDEHPLHSLLTNESNHPKNHLINLNNHLLDDHTNTYLNSQQIKNPTNTFLFQTETIPYQNNSGLYNYLNDASKEAMMKSPSSCSSIVDNLSSIHTENKCERHKITLNSYREPIIYETATQQTLNKQFPALNTPSAESNFIPSQGIPTYYKYPNSLLIGNNQQYDRMEESVDNCTLSVESFTQCGNDSDSDNYTMSTTDEYSTLSNSSSRHILNPELCVCDPFNGIITMNNNPKSYVANRYFNVQSTPYKKKYYSKLKKNNEHSSSLPSTYSVSYKNYPHICYDAIIPENERDNELRQVSML